MTQKTERRKLEMISFRLEPELINELDLIAERLAGENFGRPNRTAVLRYLIAQDRQRNKSEKIQKKKLTLRLTKALQMIYLIM